MHKFFANSTIKRYFTQNIYLNTSKGHTNVLAWVTSLQARGIQAFSVKHAREALAGQTETAIRRALDRLSAKGTLISLHKGYYLIIPPQYSARGILPPPLFLDGLMNYLERPYYVGLLNAASFHGASHQQPQEYYVFTGFPVLRPLKKKNVKVNYISKKEIPDLLLEKRKTETGFLTISSPELTAADLLRFDKRIGGLNRAATVLDELSEAINPEKFTTDFFKAVQDTTIQRLGYLLDKVLKKTSIAEQLFEQSKKEGSHFYRIPLKTSAPIKGFTSDEKWKVIVNTQIEMDE
ncbi:MAG TPA: type IV toxin-antitoxin system AbiEi family antitoxin [Puia sp.]